MLTLIDIISNEHLFLIIMLDIVTVKYTFVRCISCLINSTNILDFNANRSRCKQSFYLCVLLVFSLVLIMPQSKSEMIFK